MMNLSNLWMDKCVSLLALFMMQIKRIEYVQFEIVQINDVSF